MKQACNRDDDMQRIRIGTLYWLVAILIAVAGVGVWIARSSPPRTLVMATGPAGRVLTDYAEQYKAILAQSGIKLKLRSTAGTLENLQLLSEPGSGVDVAFLSAGTTDPDKSPGLRTLGTVSMDEVWFFYRDLDSSKGDLGEALHGKRLSIGPSGSESRVVALALLKLNGIDSSTTELLGLSRQEAMESLRLGDIQAALFVASADAPLIRELLADPKINLLSFKRAAAYVALYPYLTRLTIPEGVGNLALNRPPYDVQTLGAPVSLVVRANMHPALQSLLLDAASQIHSGPGMFNAANQFPAAQAIDLPLSEPARQYYKSGRPFLQRYMPFWLAVLVSQLLIAAIPLLGIFFPLMRLTPTLYSWLMQRRILRLYNELDSVEIDLETKPDVERALLRERLEELEQRVSHMHIPVAFAPTLYTLREHINLVRSRL